MALSSNLNEKNKTASKQILNEINRLNEETNILNSSRTEKTEKIKKQVPVEIDTLVEK
ncbi:hypothetical protein HOG21_04790 [bacterium]|nr:hypothetical protein [bacterium]